MKRRQRYRIGVLMWMSQEYGRRVLTGALDRAQRMPGVEVELIGVAAPNRDPEEEYRKINELDGVVAVLQNHEMIARRKRIEVPIVAAPLVGGAPPPPSVSTDSEVVARLTIEHFLSLRLRHVAICNTGAAMSNQRLVQAFDTTAREHGMVVLNPFEHSGRKTPMAPWLKQLPLPAGLFCDKDGLAESVSAAAAELGIAVPSELAVLSIGNDPIRCMHRRPTLSSIDVPAEQIGRRAVDLMVQLLEGGAAASIRVTPTGVVQRDSTRMVAIDDRAIAEAVQYIRTHFAEPITAREIAAHVGMPRRTLTYRFGKAMGHSVSEELTRCRLQKATALLLNTDESVKAIALSIGKMRLNNFSRFIKHHTGLSPSEYRKQGHA